MLLLLATGDARASAWPQPAGSARLSLAYSGLVSDRQFALGDAGGLLGPLCPEPILGGQRSPYSCVTGGTFTAHQTTLAGAVGVTEHLSVDVAMPVVWSSFSDDNGTNRASGVGDVRAGLRLGTLAGRWALSGDLTAQAPTGPRNFQDREVPIGQGQWDVTASARAGVSLWPHGWVEMHQGIRLRLRNGETGINPGEEWVGQAGGGWTPVPWTGVLAQIEWIVAARNNTTFGIKSPGRRLLQARTGLFVRTGRWWVDAGVATPLAGRSWPVAPVATAGVAYTVGGS